MLESGEMIEGKDQLEKKAKFLIMILRKIKKILKEESALSAKEIQKMD